jgi:hypothetical protein
MEIGVLLYQNVFLVCSMLKVLEQGQKHQTNKIIEAVIKINNSRK